MEIDSIDDVSSYEILGKRSTDSTQAEPLIRKFPLSLDENFKDEYQSAVRYLYREGSAGVERHIIDGVPFICIYVNKRMGC